MPYPWVKLYTEMIHDPKLGRLSEHLQLVFVKLLCATGEYDGERRGLLPPVDDLAWALRTDDQAMALDLAALESVGLVGCDGGVWRVTNFSTRQAAMTVSERKQAQRDKERTGQGHGHVTICDTEGEGEGDKTRLEGEGDETSAAPSTLSRLATGLKDLGIEPNSQIESQAYINMAEDITSTPTPDAFIDSLLLEISAARSKSERGHPPGIKYIKAVVERALRENRLPGEKLPAPIVPPPRMELVTEQWRNPITGELETHKVGKQVAHGNS